MLGLPFCARAFSSCGERGPLFIAVRGPLTIAASLVAEHRLQTCRLSSCGSWAYLLRGMWDLPRPGLEPVSPALAGRLSTTVPPGKPHKYCFEKLLFRLYTYIHISVYIYMTLYTYLNTEPWCEMWQTNTFENIELDHYCFYPGLVAIKEVILGEGET